MTDRPRVIQKQADARAGRMCSNCNMLRPDEPRMHCESGRCGWWVCPRCNAWNDTAGRNSITDLMGRKKDRPTR